MIEAEIEQRGEATSLLLAAFQHERALERHEAALNRLDRLRALGWSVAHYGLSRGDVLQAIGDLAAARSAWKMGLTGLDKLPTRRRTTRAALEIRSELMNRLEVTQ